VTLTGWRDLTSDKTFRPDGSVASDTLTIADTSGTVTFSSTNETTLDGLGRVGAFKVDGAMLYTLRYDDEGRLQRADFTSGEAITFDYDPVTHERRGHELQSPDSTGGVQWERDPRGFVAAETYTNGATTTRRGYGYDGRGALTRATTGADIASYTYTASGLPNSISDLAGARSVHHTSDHLIVGDVAYTWDAAGRVIGKGEWTFAYGANGQLTHASRPGRQVDFVYDDGGNRVLKRVDGVPVRANVAGGVLTEDHFVELVVIGGVVAGVLDNGHFTAVLTDPRGTPFTGPDGTPGLASPYGVRASHLGFAEVVDYARLGWDPDLDVVRMGVRDYDPKLSQFLTPDPLYFEDLEKCQGSPLQCSLYGYAGGNPISFIDPTGLGLGSWLQAKAADLVQGGFTVAGAVGGALLAIEGGPVAMYYAGTAGAAIGGGIGHAAASLIRDGGKSFTAEGAVAAIANSATGDMAFAVGGYFVRPLFGGVRAFFGRLRSLFSGNADLGSNGGAPVPAGPPEAPIQSPPPLRNVPADAEIRVLTPDKNGGAQYGVEYKWTNSEGKTIRWRVHGPSQNAPPGSNAASGEIYRVQVGKRYMDINGNLYPKNVHNPDSPHYDPEAANNTHIPFPGLFVWF